MPSSQNIPNTRMSGTQTIALPTTTSAWTIAEVVLDRTINGGLNSLNPGDTLNISIDYSPDGVNWQNVGGSTLQGGIIVTKGVTLAQEVLAIGIGQPFPIGTAFRLNTVASTPVRIAGTVTYS
jgi:hypothetical protein